MNRKSAPVIVGRTTSCGVRRYCSTVRRAACPVAVRKPAPVPAAIFGAAARASRVTSVVTAVMVSLQGSGRVRGGVVGIGTGRPDRLSGEREEHLVERRPAQADVVDRDPSLVEKAHDDRELRGT